MGRLEKSAILVVAMGIGLATQFAKAQDYSSYGAAGSTGVRLGSPIPTGPSARGYRETNQIYHQSDDRNWDSLSNRYSDGPGGGYEYGARKPNDDLPCPPDHDQLPLPVTRASIWGHDRKQPFTLDYVFIPRSNVDDPSTDMQMHEIGLTYMFRIPLGERWLLTFRPFFDVMFLSGPGGPSPQVPEQLYKVAIDVQADFKINEMFGIMLGITPGFWTDFNSVGGDDFRLPVRILGTARVNEQLYVAAGLLYTDNIRRNLLPTGGVIWDFADKWRAEVMYPRSRLVYKFHEELQFYGAVERGGDTWNIRENGINEDFEYRDLRISLGTQVDVWERASFFVETGVAFARKMRFDVQPERDASSAFVLRVGSKF